MSEQPSENVAAVRLARALSDALYPDATADKAMLARAILHPICLDTVLLMADDGFSIVADSNPYGLYASAKQGAAE